MRTEERLIISRTIEAIEAHPERFERDCYHVRERGKKFNDGIEVWVANGKWGLSVDHDGTKVADGGVAMLSLAPWRYRLWRACMAIPSLEDAVRVKAVNHLRSLAA